jgi:hypothetical protein
MRISKKKFETLRFLAHVISTAKAPLGVRAGWRRALQVKYNLKNSTRQDNIPST